jgi:hypothetical protein
MVFVIESPAHTDRGIEHEGHQYLCSSCLGETSLSTVIFPVRYLNVFYVRDRSVDLARPVDTATFLHGLTHLRVFVDRSSAEADVLALAGHRGPSVYDPAYIFRREGAPLATLNVL